MGGGAIMMMLMNKEKGNFVQYILGGVISHSSWDHPPSSTLGSNVSISLINISENVGNTNHQQNAINTAFLSEYLEHNQVLKQVTCFSLQFISEVLRDLHSPCCNCSDNDQPNVRCLSLDRNDHKIWCSVHCQ